MTELIAVAVQLATQVLGFIQTEQLLKYVREMKNLQDDLHEEIAKGAGQDDAKIEAIYDKLSTTFNAFNQQVAILQAAKGAPVTVPSSR